MRQLHTTAFHEKFAASGLYAFEQKGKPATITEAWAIHRLPDQSQIVRVDHDERFAPAGMSILLEALRAPTGHIQRFDLHLYNPNGKHVQKTKASYTIFDDYIQIGRQINDLPRQDEEIERPLNTVIDPLLRVFTGLVIRQVIELGGKDISVFTPNMLDLDSSQALSGIIEKRSAALVGSETLIHSGQTVSARRYRFIGGADDEQSVFWLDETDLLIAYESKSWRITLKNHARSNDFSQ